MTIVLWVLQVMLAIHTVMGAVWKWSHTAPQTMPSLQALSGSVWLTLSIVELLCSLCLILPLVSKSLGLLPPIAASVIAAEMVLFAVVHLASGATVYGPLVYWGVVALLCAFIAVGRFVVVPL